jgi:hypothetical protein
MNPIETGAAVVFACVFGGALFGMFLHTVPPEQHLQSNSTEVLKLATGVAGTDQRSNQTQKDRIPT